MLVTLNEVTVSYTDKKILDNVSFSINDNDKIGIVGINGTGKSTLLKTILGEVDIQSGEIFRKSGIKIAYLPQQPKFDENASIIDTALKESKVDNEYEIKAMLSKLGIDNLDSKISTLSGGEKRRLALAITLVKQCDLLILDEPTNHLDIWMINWLEKYLTKWSKALLLVTHDRYFLERITNKTLDIELGNVYLYDVNYSNYLNLKVERAEYQQANYRKLKAVLKKEAAWAALNPQARSTKSTERLKRYYELEDKTNKLKNNINEINYYISISIEQNLSYRQLREKIKSKEYQRLDDKTKLKLINKEETVVSDFIKNPIVIRNKYNIDKESITEKILQRLILEDIPSFLKELGDGFTFVENEYKIKIGNTFNYIDLLLYNIKFNCYVVIELKVTELKKEHIGQIQIYMNYVDKNIKTINQDKTIGVIICKKDNGYYIEYSSDNRIFSKNYILS